MSLSHSPSQTKNKLEGVYLLKQPGFRPHPVLKHRQRQRSDFQRSAGLLLATNSASQLPTAGSAAPDADQPLDFRQWSADFAKSGTLLPLGEVTSAAWTQPNLAKDVPPRLEDCRLRLEEVERELNRYSRAVGGSGFRAVKQQYELPAFVQDFQGYQERARSLPQIRRVRSFKRASRVSGEGTPAEVLEATGPEVELEDEYAAQLEPQGEDEVPEQLSSVQQELLKLDSKWQSIEQQRLAAAQERDELQGRLASGKVVERELQERLRAAKRDLGSAEADLQSLRQLLSVSEGRAEALRQSAAALDLQKATLGAQYQGLLGRIAALDEEAAALQDADDADSESEDDQPIWVDPKDVEPMELELRGQFAAELALERSARLERQAALEEALAAAAERQRLAHAEAECLAIAHQEREATGASEEESEGAVESAESMPVEMSVPPCTTVTALELNIPDNAAVPELVLLTDLPSEEGRGPARGSRPAPARCQIDIARNELCFQMLAPTGPLCTWPLADITATRPDCGPGNIVELEVAGSTGEPLQLAVTDAHAASELVAALGLPDRVAPGFDMGF